jgi:hypothetical protein
MIPHEVPKLNPWPFIAVDAVLLGSAAYIANQQPHLTGTPVVVVGALVFLGAIIALIPFVLNFARRQETALLERQHEIAALAQSTGASAEQLSIAAASLHAIADSAAKAAKQAEHLPQKLQEKIHEFKEQLNEVNVAENESLAQEVNTLRSAETERIETVVTTVRKLSSEIARLEQSSRQNVGELTATLTKFTTSAEQAAAEASTAIASLRAEAEKSLVLSQRSATGAIESALSHALAEIETKLSTLTGTLIAKIDHAASAAAAAEPRPRRKNAAPPAEAMETPSTPAPAVTRSSAEPAVPSTATTASAPDVEQPSARGNVEIAPAAEVAPAETPSISASASAAPTLAASAPASTIAAEPEVETPKPSTRKRAAKRGADENELSLGLDVPPNGDEYSQLAPDESAVSTDGLTRLLVTAYIGIGNKLYVRGDAPGLSWERGTPLQFVSIGKWRWETAEAAGPVHVRVYKNDETECTSLGEVTIEPGHQREVAANF